VGAHLAALRRTRAGNFGIGQSVTLDQLSEQMKTADFAALLITPDAALSHLPFVDLGEEDARRVRNGIEVQLDGQPNTDWPDEQPVRMRAHGQLMAIGRFTGSDTNCTTRVIDVEK